MSTLFTVVSKGSAQPGVYQLGDIQSPGVGTPTVGLYHCLQEKPTRVVALLTEAAEAEDNKNWQNIRQELGPVCTGVRIPDGRDLAELEQLAAQLMQHIQPEAPVVLDISGGLRHHQFAVFATLVYLTQVRKVELMGLYSAAYELKSDEGMIPIVDLTGILDWVRWFWALKNWTDYRDLNGFITLLKEQLTSEQMKATGQLRSPLQDLRWFFLNAMPVELSFVASKYARLAVEIQAQLPWAPAVALGELQQEGLFRRFALTESFDKVKNYKEHARLNQAELDRQLLVASVLLEHGHLVPCMTLLAEWSTSLLIFRCFSEQQRTLWLDFDSTRNEARQVLIRIARLMSTQQRESAEVVCQRWGLPREYAAWASAVHDLRNKIAHNGMNRLWVDLKNYRDRIEIQLKEARSFLEKSADWSPDPSLGEHTVVVIPLGHTPGVVYSALSQTGANRALVFTSEDALPGLDPALHQADFSDTDVLACLWHDPFSGFHEVKAALDRADVQAFLLSAGSVHVCLTGGTTCLSHAASEVSQWCRQRSIPCRRFALIDRRSAHVQKEEPWVLGEIHWLDPAK